MLSYRSYKKAHFLKPSRLTLDDLKRICLEMYEINNSAHINEKAAIDNLFAILDGDTEEIKQRKNEAKTKEQDTVDRHALVTITVEGSSGEFFTIIPGDDLETVFSKLNLPNKISKVKFDNWSNFNLFANKMPNFRLTVALDFRDRPVWKFQDANLQNESVVEVNGTQELWVLGSLEKLKKTVEGRASNVANFFHKHLKYDVILWLLGIPGVIMVLRNYAPSWLESFTPGLQGISYLSLSLLFLLFFRAFYNYLKWLFPFMELKEQPKEFQLIQRSVAVFIALGIISGWLSLLAEFILHRRP